MMRQHEYGGVLDEVSHGTNNKDRQQGGNAILSMRDNAQLPRP